MPLGENVDRAAVPLDARAGDLPRVELGITLGKRRPDARPFEFLVEPARDRQNGVADLLGTEPATRLVPVKAVFRINFRSERRRFVGPVVVRRLPIDFGGQDQAVQGFDVPAAGDEFLGQPVKELRMRRRRCLRAEVVGVLDEAAAEMSLPDAVDDHAGHERIGRIGEPAGERRATPGDAGQRPTDLGDRLGLGGEGRQEARLHFAERLVIVAACQKKRRRNRAGDFVGRHHVGRPWRLRTGRFESGDFAAQFGQALAVLRAHLGQDLRFADGDLAVGPEIELSLQAGPLVGGRVDRGQHVGRKPLAAFAGRAARAVLVTR